MQTANKVFLFCPKDKYGMDAGVKIGSKAAVYDRYINRRGKMQKNKGKRTAIVSNKVKCIIGSALSGAGVIILCVSRISRTFSQWYSTHIYPMWVNTFGRFLGAIPFSVSELLLYAAMLTAVLAFVRGAASAVKKCITKEKAFKWSCTLYSFAGMLLFLYAVNCGVNYNRVPFSESSGICPERYSAEELKSVCLWLTEEVNNRRAQVARDAAGVMRLGAVHKRESGGIGRGTKAEGQKMEAAYAKAMGEEAVLAMKRLGESYPELSGYYPNPKGLFFPWILSVQQLRGVYSPFTIEANYNSAIVDYNIPFTACHELSHLRGFMQEEEANFIAFLASIGSDNVYFQYSGYLMGWKYCMSALYKADYDAWEEVRGRLAEEAEPDLDANREFWDRYDGKIAEAANKVNDTYLKANNQAEGVESYNQMVDFIVAYKSGTHSF